MFSTVEVFFTLQTNDPNAQAAQLANVTQDTAGLDAAEIAVTSVLLGDLSTEAVNNSQVRVCYNTTHLPSFWLSLVFCAGEERLLANNRQSATS